MKTILTNWMTRKSTTRQTTATARRRPAAATVPCGVESLESRRLMSTTISGVTDFGTLTGRRTQTDSVSSSDTVDYFKVKMATTGRLAVTLGNLSANADLKLIKDDNGNGKFDAGEVKASSTNGGTTTESFVKSNLSGTYFVQVTRVSGSPSYKLTLTPDYAGADYNVARNLGSFSGGKQVKDFVGASDGNDFHKIVLTGTKTLKVNLTGSAKDLDLELDRDGDGNGKFDDGSDLFHRSNTPNTSTESFQFTLSAGTYYVRVFRGVGGGDVNYTLDLKIS